MVDAGRPDPPRAAGASMRGGPSFRVRLTAGLLVAAVVPLAAFGLAVAAAGIPAGNHPFLELLLVALATAALLALVVAYLLAAELTAPLRRIADAIDGVQAGRSTAPVPVIGDDELARLAESHNRVALATARRNRALAALVDALCEYAPGEGVHALMERAATDARRIFELIDCDIRLVDPNAVPTEERVPGDPLPLRAILLAGAEPLGVLVGHLPATRIWEPADQNLLLLFASEVGVAIRNAELFARIESQNARLVELDAAKDAFLRSVSHNLQTPLTSIRAYADQLLGTTTDATTSRRLAIIADQSDRLSRLVRQLLTLSRIEAGALRSAKDVIALAPHVRKTWEALAAGDVPFRLRDDSEGWLAVADADQLDQILWALLDNAVKYGGRAGGIDAVVTTGARSGVVRLTVIDHGPGIGEADREWLFTRFGRGPAQSTSDGTGLGLHVSRELARAMGGDLRLEPSEPGFGAAFTLELPGESPEDGG